MPIQVAYSKILQQSVYIPKYTDIEDEWLRF